MLKRIVIENYRSCLRTSIDLHPNLSVLIGPNGSGKTNILQAIMLLNKIAQARQHRPSNQGAATVSSRIKATFQQGGSRVQLSASVDAYTDESNHDVMLGSRQKWLVTDTTKKDFSFKGPLPVPEYSAVYSREHFLPTYTSARRFYVLGRGDVLLVPNEYAELPGKRQKQVLRTLRRVGAYCDGIRYYGASQFTNPGSCPVSFPIEQEGNRRRLFRLRGHARVLYDMYSAQKADRSPQYSQFLEIVGPKGLRLIDDLRFREVPTSSSDYSVRVGGTVEVRSRHQLLVIPQFRIGKRQLSPNQLSEGTFKTLALLFHVMTEESAALLVEEPEVCVHHGLLSSILELVKSYSRHKQMILSTHSDYVLDQVKPENVYRVALEKPAGTTVRQISKAMTSKEFSALREYLDKNGNLGEYWREGGLGDPL